jgi:hypothetical protein
MLESGDQVASSGDGKVGGGRGGHGDLCWEPRECVSDSFGSGVPDPDTVAAVVFGGGSEVPAVNGMWRPGTAGGRLFVN